MNNLKRILTGLGVKQTEFASISGLSISTISKICSNAIIPSEVTKNKVLRTLNEKFYTNKEDLLVDDLFPSYLNEAK